MAVKKSFVDYRWKQSHRSDTYRFVRAERKQWLLDYYTYRFDVVRYLYVGPWFRSEPIFPAGFVRKPYTVRRMRNSIAADVRKPFPSNTSATVRHTSASRVFVRRTCPPWWAHEHARRPVAQCTAQTSAAAITPASGLRFFFPPRPHHPCPSSAVPSRPFRSIIRIYVHTYSSWGLFS